MIPPPPTIAPARHVAIIGAGFSGALQAINLLRHDGPRATLIERGTVMPRGVAYSAAHRDHLLNVRAGNMSALPDDPDHFVRWLEARGLGKRTTFVPRLVYGDYLSDLLAETRARLPDRLTVVQGEARDVRLDIGGATITLADGTSIAADTVILAPGNLPPHLLPGIDPPALPDGAWLGQPWAGGVADGLGADDDVLVIGSGLTMVDVALLLDAEGFRGRIVALSRHGLLPRVHADGPMPPPLLDRPVAASVGLLRHVRARAAAIGWRGAVDELRPWTQALWTAAALDERRRFLRHVRAWWDVHRHRIAPAIAARLDMLQAEGRLTIVAGKLADASTDGDGVRIRYRPRGEDAIETLRVRRIINATGPQGDLLRTDDPLLLALRTSGLIRPDPLRLGIDVNAQSEVIDAAGRAQPRLLALGPITKGAFWEIVAVPDIRRQTWSVARRLSNAHWVGGEGL